MGAFMDATCRCGKRIGWMGKVSDRPRCPRCGHRPSEEELAADEADFAEVERRMLADDDVPDNVPGGESGPADGA